MPLDWIDVTDLSFNTLLLLETEQLAWLPGWLPEPELGTALLANPAVDWFLRHKNAAIAEWVESVRKQGDPEASPEANRDAERAVLASMNDLVCYAVDPAIYDSLPFLGWDSRELTDLVEFRDRLVVDVGTGTGRLGLVAAEAGARAVFAVEPVGNLRRFVREKARRAGLTDVFVMDGLITALPFPDDFVDILLGGHVFGDAPEAEHAEMTRIVRPGGLIVLCPGNNDQDDDRHAFLVDRGYEWSRFEEPGDGLKRKYWRTA